MARAGSAPRNLAFHPTLPVAWVINELGNTVTTYHGASKMASCVRRRFCHRCRRFYRRQHGRGNLPAPRTGVLFTVRIEATIVSPCSPWIRKREPCDRPAGCAKPGQDAALHRARSVPAVSFTSQRTERHGGSFRVDRKTGH